MPQRSLLFVALAVALLTHGAAGAPQVLCTTTIVGDVVSHVAGDRLVVDVLLPVNADPHTFEMTPQDAVKISQADVLFLNGAGLETFLAPFLSGVAGRVIDLSHGLPVHDSTGSDPHGDEATTDPHVWFDPTYVMQWTDLIASTLAELDPIHADEYARRADEYKQRLEELDAWIRLRIDAVPREKRRLVTDHASFGYFAARYGFDQVGTVFPGLSTLSEPSAREIAVLEDAIVSFAVPTVFIGTTVNPSLAERVAADTGVRVAFLYIGSLSSSDGPASSYLELMRYDVEEIVKGLQTP